MKFKFYYAVLTTFLLSFCVAFSVFATQTPEKIHKISDLDDILLIVMIKCEASPTGFITINVDSTSELDVLYDWRTDSFATPQKFIEKMMEANLASWSDVDEISSLGTLFLNCPSATKS